MRSEKGLDYLDKPFTVETVRKFRGRKDGLPEWMLTLLDMVEKSLEDCIVEIEVFCTCH